MPPLTGLMDIRMLLLRTYRPKGPMDIGMLLLRICRSYEHAAPNGANGYRNAIDTNMSPLTRLMDIRMLLLRTYRPKGPMDIGMLLLRTCRLKGPMDIGMLLLRTCRPKGPMDIRMLLLRTCRPYGADRYWNAIATNIPPLPVTNRVDAEMVFLLNVRNII